MRIALVSTVSSPVREDAGGSIESWTWLMARELQALGHNVTTFGCAGSEVAGEMVNTLPGPYGAPGSFDDWQLCEWLNLCRAVEQSARFDLLHTQAYLWGIPLQKLSQAPMLHTLHIVPDENATQLWASAPESRLTALSKHQWSHKPDLKPEAIIPHGVDVSQFAFRKTPDDYVLYLGRFTSGKGPVQAIETARTLGLRLLLAGPENAYFREQVRPLVDGKQIEYVGYAGPAERSRLMGGARALLYPLQHPESFGLVLVEAMLCGTPIAATDFGAVPEIVEPGVSGFISSTQDAFPGVVEKCFNLDRKAIRERAQARYSAAAMARAYAEVYQRLVANRS